MVGANDNGFRMTSDGYMRMQFRYKGRQVRGPKLNSVELLAKSCRPCEPIQNFNSGR